MEHYAHLLAVARRHSRVPDDAEDLLHDALLEAVRSGRHDFTQAATLRWLAGTIRNLGAMTARGAVRRRLRDAAWSATRATTTAPAVADGVWRAEPAVAALLASLPPSLRRVAELALAGCDRQEIAWLLGLSDGTLRQRIAALRKRLGGLSLDGAPDADPPPTALPVGLIRRALLPVVRVREAAGSHDPDGHLLVLSRRPPGAA
ncbi:MAG TPA: sigma-70 family RNA polymerase sigma factor [Gemmatimonadaceae bacterium]|nr:sigma-70 family RNA polymerase sigma factor [Gemmatimonadaceae bacterium]